MLTISNTSTPSDGNGLLEVIIQGMKIRLVFAAGQNTEVSTLVREVLKSSYLRRQGT